VTLMRQMAHALGKKDEEERFAKLFDHIRAAFAQEFVHSDGFIPGADNGPSPFGQINNPDAKARRRYPDRLRAGAEYAPGSRPTSRCGGSQLAAKSKPTTGCLGLDFSVPVLCWQRWSKPGTAILHSS